MVKHELINKIAQEMGSEATALDAAFVYDHLADTYGRPVEDALKELDEQAFSAAVDQALKRGCDALRRELEGYWGGALPNSVRDALENGNAMQAIREYLRAMDHQVAGGTSETCIADGHEEALNEIERCAARYYTANLAYGEELRWWTYAYKVLAAARKAGPSVDLAAVCEYLRDGDIDSAAEETEMDW